MKFPICLFFCILSLSCDSFKEKKNDEAVARVWKTYLYKKDILNIIPKGTSKEDSLLIVRHFIDDWATQKLLIDAAERNINNVKKQQLDKLINQYKIDLYTKAYIEEVVKQTVDTVVSEQELKSYYDKNKENFKTSGTIVKIRYLHLFKSNPKFVSIRNKFFNYSKKDKKFWNDNSLQFKNYSLNDSIWIDLYQVYEKIRFITPENRDEYIINGKQIEKTIGKDVYLIKITNLLDKNKIAPLDYLKPTIKEVILNKRKLELIQNFEKEITNDAIKNNDYEIYN
jgi:hypothetical protein